MDKTGRLGTPQDKAGNYPFSFRLSSSASGLNGNRSRLAAERYRARLLFRHHDTPYHSFIIILLINQITELTQTPASFCYYYIIYLSGFI